MPISATRPKPLPDSHASGIENLKQGQQAQKQKRERMDRHWLYCSVEEFMWYLEKWDSERKAKQNEQN